MTMPVWVIVDCAPCSARAMPKSITLTAPESVMITLAGLMSRCTIPCWCEYARASSTPETMISACSGGGASAVRSRSRMVRPSTSSITMYGTVWPPTTSSPESYTATIAWWLRPATDCASRVKRALETGSSARSERSSFTATVRPSRTSSAA